MSIDGWIAIGILLGSGFTILKRWAPTELVALGIPVLLVLTGVLEPAEALQGFGNHAVIAIAAVFVVGAGLSGSGLAGLVARFILRLAGQHEATILALLMGAAALVSGFMSNAATTALFLPTAVTLSRRALISPSRLLMPLAAASVLGGTLTMIGTPPNLIVSAFREARTGDPFSVLDFTRVAVPIVLMGILYTVTVGRKLLPERTSHDRLREALLPEAIAESYGVARNLARLKIGAHSEVAGRTIAEVDIRRRYGLSVVLVNRHVGPVSRYFDPRPDLRFEEGDVLYVEGDDEAAWRFGEEKGLQYGLAGPRALERILGRGQTLAEVSIAPRSPVLGRSLRDLRFRDRWGLNALSLWRHGAAVANPADLPLAVGDAFLVSGPISSVRELAKDPDYLVLTDLTETVDTRRAPLAFLLLLVAVLPPLFGWLPLAISSLAAALLAVVTRCVGLEEARRAIEWRVVFLIAGTIPLGLALEKTGVAATVAHTILELTTPLGEPATLAALFLVAATVSVTSSNSAAAVILAPIAGEVASTGAVHLDTGLLAVAFGASCAFILPIPQWNLMVMGPGGYRAPDFLRFGAGLSVVMAITTVLGLWFLH